MTATSSTQIGGAKTTYTDETGAFRMRALIPGAFEVRAQAPKLSPVVQKDVQVGITAAAELTFIMEVQTTADEVMVVQKAPLVSTTRANVTEDFSSEFVEALPHAGRDNIHRDMLGSVAGSVANRMRGGSANQTIVTQDGFDMGPPGKTISPSLKSSAAFEIQTAGYGADNPTASGGVLNLVTRSGSNKFEFEFNATADSNSLQFFRDERDTRSDTFYYVINPMVAGPIIQDKLWFFINTETHFTQDGRQPDIEGIFRRPPARPADHPEGVDQADLAGDQPEQAVGHHQLRVALRAQPGRRRGHRARGPGGPQDPANLPGRHLGVGAARRPHPAQSGGGDLSSPSTSTPRCCRDNPDCDQIPATVQTFPRQQRLGNSHNHTRTDVYGLQFVNRLEWLPSGKLLGEHSLQIKDRFYTEQEVRKASRPGDRLYELNGPNPLALTTFYANDPRYEEPRFGWFIGTDTLTKNVITLVRQLAAHPPSHLDPVAVSRLRQRQQQRRRRRDRHEHLGAGPGRRLGRHPRRAIGGAGQRQQLCRSGRRGGGPPHHRQPGFAALPLEPGHLGVRQQLRDERRTVAQHHRAALRPLGVRR